MSRAPEGERFFRDLTFWAFGSSSAMRYRLFFLLWVAALAALCAIVGILALLGYSGAEISLWSARSIESKTGKTVWIISSLTCFAAATASAVSEYRKKR
jgi:NADH:ubiquinone oxidoreductase subunit H